MERCNGCGYCCSSGVCSVGRRKYNTWQAPCPGLEWDEEEKRYWCQAIKEIERERPGDLTLHRELAVGLGCFIEKNKIFTKGEPK